MKLHFIILLIGLGFLPVAYADVNENAKFITDLYKNVYEKKDFAIMNNYFSKNLLFYKDFDKPVSLTSLKNHLIEQGEQCTKVNMLPFDQILISGNRVTTLYTQKCTDKLNKIHNKRIMAITEINENRKVSEIRVVTHEQT